MSGFLTKPELIRKKKSEGVLNSELMRQYKIDYETLRKILDGGNKDGSSINRISKPNSFK